VKIARKVFLNILELFFDKTFQHFS
jgi:hypothetical protein